MEIDEKIKEIAIMPEGKNKNREIIYLKGLLVYLFDDGFINKEIMDNYHNIINRLFANDLPNIIEECRQRNDDLLQITNRLTPLYKKILLKSKNYSVDRITFPYINRYQYFDVIKEFFNWVDPLLLNIFNNLYDNGMILEHSINHILGRTYRVGDNQYKIIINPNISGFEYLLTLVHEIAHVYFYQLSKLCDNYYPKHLFSECLPITIEQLLITFLDNNSIFEEEIKYFENFEHTTSLAFMDCSYVSNIETRKNPNWKPNKTTYDEYLKKSIIKPNHLNNYKSALNIKKNKYSYASLFSLVVKNRFIKDENWGRDFLREYPTLSLKLPCDKVLDMFSEKEYVESFTNETVKLLKK